MENNFKDTYFLNSATALKEAKQQNRVMCTITIDGLQICYYNGKKIKDSPKNFISVPLDKMDEYFSKTKNRFPQIINFDNTNYKEEEKESLRKYITDMSNKALIIRNELRIKYMRKIKLLQPDFKDKKLRVFVPACRETVVMQHVSADLASTFKSKGYEVKFFIQKNDMQGCDSLSALKALYKFNPHITITINHLSNSYLNPNIFNVIWFQDLMPILTNEETIHTRKRDIFFSYQTLFDEMLIKKGIHKKNIHRQFITTADSTVFYEDKKIKRKNKIVFVGSHYSLKDSSTLSSFLFHHEEIYFDLIKIIEKGKDLSRENIFKVFAKHKQRIHSHPGFFNFIQQAMLRNISVNWMCSNKNTSVDLYGYHWKELNIESINKAFKGSATKQEVLHIYNSAKYVLLASGQVINTQRLAEVIMCGAIPVIYDSRSITDEEDTWDDKCLYFKTEKDLHAILKNNIVPKKKFNDKDKKKFSYDRFTKIIETNISKYYKLKMKQ